MTRPKSVDLFKNLCTTLASCAEIERSQALETALKAREVRFATEELAISMLNQEIAQDNYAVTYAYISASLRVIDHLRTITCGPHEVGDWAWSRIFDSASPERVIQMIDRGLSPKGGAYPLLNHATSGVQLDLLFSHFAKPGPLTEEQVGVVVRMCSDGQHVSKLDACAQLLELQVKHYPDEMAYIAGKQIADGFAINLATALILAGLSPSKIIAHAQTDDSFSKFVLSRISSNHGLMALHSTCGDLKTFLENRDGLQLKSHDALESLHKAQA
jgi:hypothetical protein